MTLLHFPCSPLHPHLSLRPISTSSAAAFRRPTSQKLPARDRVIDFGKNKGRMLGTLPSKYLLWVSRNLRAGDFEEWAKLADEVLCDPVYRDRLEWESAEQVLTGDGRGNSRSDSPAADLLEIAGRFGWDNHDKAGWGRVDFHLLGTSRGGRIPRIRNRTAASGWGNGEMGFPGSEGGSTSRKKDWILGQDSGVWGGDFGVSGTGSGRREEEEEEEVVRGKRGERRERQRVRRGEQQMQRLSREVGLEEGGGGNCGDFMIGGRVLESPFPGRGVLLDKIKNRLGD